MQEKLLKILAPYKRQKGATIPVLQKVQQEYGYLSEENIAEIANFLGISKNEIYGVASFYAQFRFQPTGKYTIKVCQGTACHVRGSPQILQAVEQELGIKCPGTTKDMKFGLERVACFGSCALAPVMVVDRTVYARMTTTKARQILTEYQKKE